MYFICVSCISTRVSGVWYSTTTLHPSEILFVSCISTFNKGVYSLVSLYLCHSTTFFLYINIQINILAGVLSSTFWCLVSCISTFKSFFWSGILSSTFRRVVSGVFYINIQINILIWCLVINILVSGVLYINIQINILVWCLVRPISFSAAAGCGK